MSKKIKCSPKKEIDTDRSLANWLRMLPDDLTLNGDARHFWHAGYGYQLALDERDRLTNKMDSLFTHEAVDAFWKVWKEQGEPHIHGDYESTWAAFRAALGGSK